MKTRIEKTEKILEFICSLSPLSFKGNKTEYGHVYTYTNGKLTIIINKEPQFNPFIVINNIDCNYFDCNKEIKEKFWQFCASIEKSILDFKEAEQLKYIEDIYNITCEEKNN